jgi:hypothetical protein
MKLVVRQAKNFRNLHKVSTRMFSQRYLVTFTKHHAPIAGYSVCLHVPVLQTIDDDNSTASSSSECQLFLTTSNIKKLATMHVVMVLYNMTKFQFVYNYQHFVLVFFFHLQAGRMLDNSEV